MNNQEHFYMFDKNEPNLFKKAKLFQYLKMGGINLKNFFIRT